jgi:hypothetical protein
MKGFAKRGDGVVASCQCRRDGLLEGWMDRIVRGHNHVTAQPSTDNKKMFHLISTSPSIISKPAVLLCQRPLVGQIRRWTPALDPSHVNPHPRRIPAAVAWRVVWPVLGGALVTASILFAPANTFDDLDCLSYCQQHCVEGGERRGTRAA